MDKIIEKYEAELECLDRAVEKTRHLMDSDTLEMMSGLRVLLLEVISDLKGIKSISNG